MSSIGSWWPSLLHTTTDWTLSVFGSAGGVRTVHLITMYFIIAWAFCHIYYEIWRTIMWKEGDIGIAFGGTSSPAAPMRSRRPPPVAASDSTAARPPVAAGTPAAGSPVPRRDAGARSMTAAQGGPAGARRVSVVGVGNILYRDEGVGVYAAHYLRQAFRFTPEIDVADGALLGFG